MRQSKKQRAIIVRACSCARPMVNSITCIYCRPWNSLLGLVVVRREKRIAVTLRSYKTATHLYCPEVS